MNLGGKKVIVGIRLDSHAKELLDWAMVKVADPGDSVVAIHVSRNSGIVDGALKLFIRLNHLYILNTLSLNTVCNSFVKLDFCVMN